jgi:hypothetical protein
MAEETLVKEALTDQMIAAGAGLTESLDRAQWPVVASFWLFDSENNHWRLVLASPAVTREGPRESYRHVSNALREMNTGVQLENVSVVSPEDPLVQVFRSVYRTGRDLEGRRVFRTAINGHFVDDAYVYRILPVAPAA